jgi:hypothetical protein
MSENAGKTVLEILRGKRGTIKDAALELGSPSWDDILHLTWEEVEERAHYDEPGFRTIHKLLKRKRFNK